MVDYDPRSVYSWGAPRPNGNERLTCNAASQDATVPTNTSFATIAAENGDVRFQIDAAAAANSPGFVSVWNAQWIGLTGITSLAVYGAVGSFVNIQYYSR